MTTIHTLVLIIHVLVGVAIVGLVLLQRGRGAETGAAFGAGASGTVFGAKGSANFLSRTTAVLATLFFVTSLGLAYIGSQHAVAPSIVDELTPAADQSAAPNSAPATGAPAGTGNGELTEPPSPGAGPAEGTPKP